QSWGWLIISHSMTLARNALASSSSMEIQLLSVAGVMQDMTRRPRVSFSSEYCLTAHWREAPTPPSAGRQHRQGTARPRDRQACSRLSAPSTSYCLPSTWIVAMVVLSSYPVYGF